jgi:hypothetical protein|tara:strand:+ start:176 stop:346 length:171 start_codon:yes stop_codon:yes gene_type:complete
MGILIMLKEGKTSTVLESAAVISDSFVKSFPDSFEADEIFDGRLGVQVLGVGMFGE